MLVRLNEMKYIVDPYKREMQQIKTGMGPAMPQPKKEEYEEEKEEQNQAPKDPRKWNGL